MRLQLLAAAAAAVCAGAAYADGEPYGSTTTTTQTTETTRPVSAPVAQPVAQPYSTTTDPTLVPQDAPVAKSEVQVDVNTPAEPKKVNDNKDHMRGVAVLAGAGVEGYGGFLAPRVQAGPAWQASVALKPSKVFGIEIGYSGATNEIRSEVGVNNGVEAGIARGADIVRNGGRVLATVGLTASKIQPYIMGGVGLDWYNVRAASSDYRNDTSGSVPLGGGLRTHFGNFTADARVGYSLLFNSDFASAGDSRDVLGVESTNSSRYQGTLSIGSSF